MTVASGGSSMSSMCRWMAWHGQPVMIEELLFKTQHGLVDQSLHSTMGAETTNGDGFGVGWYGMGERPGVYRSVLPAWGDANLRHLAAHIESPLFLAHVRATSGTAVQESNCHPFVHGRWLFVHNGLINDFHAVRRDLMLALDAQSFAAIEGSTDSEVIFHLALAQGLEHDPLGALASTLGQVEETLRRNGIAPGLQASIGVSDGACLWAVRYSTERRSRTLFASANVDAVRKLHPDNPRLQLMREGDRIVVSEPLADLPGVWHEILESTAIIVDDQGSHETRPFTPRV
jgi:predicted glutamine amidotransferase